MREKDGKKYRREVNPTKLKSRSLNFSLYFHRTISDLFLYVYIYWNVILLD